MNHILINATHKEEIRVAIVRNQKLTDLNIETSLNQKTKGNIYKARISRVEQSLEAAFIDYGKEKHGFLPFKEVSEFFANGITPKGNKLTIGDVLKEGQEIIVQVEKEERGNKGAALSTYINLAGAYMILTPNNPKSSGISRQVSTADRQALKDLVPQIQLAKHSGLIIRTEGAGKCLEELQWEVDHLTQLWRSIRTAAKKQSDPFLIYQESDITIRAIRDYLREDTDSVIIDDLETYQGVREFVSFVMPHYLDRIKLFDSSEHTLFAHMSIETQVKSVFTREVSLKSGATIVFDHTEALTAIDINSARATKGANIEETAYKTNLHAAAEIAAQIQLRDIGGLIVIDFIDMSSAEHRQAIEKAMEKATANDRARVQIGNISRFGLLELSRQRLESSVSESISRTCSQCHGSGHTPTIPTLALSIIRQLEDTCNGSKQTGGFTVQSTVEVITYILNEKRQYILDMETKHGVRITLLPNQYLHFPAFNITKQKGVKRSQHKSYQGISKPQDSLDLGLIEKPTKAVITTNHPTTKKPEKKVSFFTKLFGTKKQSEDKKPRGRQQNRNRNQNQNQNRNRNQNQGQDQNQNQNRGNQNKDNTHSKFDNQNRGRNPQQKTVSKQSNRPSQNQPNKSAEKQQDKPIDILANKPVESQTSKLVENPVSKPVKSQVSKVIEKTVTKPIETQTTKPVEKAVAKTVEKTSSTTE
jgi:ribonuclease E